jgi:hypothetical protein
MPALNAIVELSSFIRDAKGNLSEPEIEELKSYLAGNPEAGDIIPGTGGVRKLRWAASGRGKRGGGRVIYYFHNPAMPLFLFNFFTKAEKSDLTGREKKSLSKVVEAIVASSKG